MISSFTLITSCFPRIGRFFLASMTAAWVLHCAGCQRTPAPSTSSSTATNTNRSVTAAAESDANRIRFQETARSAGVDFTYRNDEQQKRASIVEVVGGGVALFDYDLDGRLDIFLPGGGQYSGTRELRGHSSQLFRQQNEWQYTSVAAIAGVAESRYYSHGASAADFNEDGFPDLLLTGYGGLSLFVNRGDGTFVEGAAEAGLVDTTWATSAAWGDIDQDGALDLFVVQYLNWSFENDPACFSKSGQRDWCSPQTFQPLANKLYLNNRDGTFRDASVAHELRNDGKGLGVVMADVDLDRDLDIYVTNDTTANFLYRNDGMGKLTEIGIQSGSGLDKTGAADGSMGVDVGDFNGDGQLDLWVVNFEQELYAMYQNIGNNLFLHATDAVGLAAESGLYVGWGTAMRDFDLDADLDLIVANGHAFQFPSQARRRQKPHVFENLARRRFRNVAAQTGKYGSADHDGRGLAVGDLDNDGALDVVISHINEPVALLRNRTEIRHHWLGFKLIGCESLRDAIGAVVHIKSENDQQMAQVQSGGSYLSSSDSRLVFGLKDYKQLESITIHWPSGKQQELDLFVIDKYMTIVEPE